MSIPLKSPREIESMRRAGGIVANTLVALRDQVELGMTTKELDQIAERLIREQGAIPAFPFINHFPGTACISINEEVVHGIPGKRVLRAGDLVKFDVGAIVDGYHGDAAITVPLPGASDEAVRLAEVTEQALVEGIRAARLGGFLHDIGAAIDASVEPSGFSIVRQLVGHGVGKALHEEPNVPHYRQASKGPRLRPGMVFTIEPMINAGTHDTRLLPDNWTIVTGDRRLSAQFEHTVAITDHGVEILSVADGGETWSIPFQSAKRVHY